MKKIIVVNVLGEVLSEHEKMWEAWLTDPGSGCHVINFLTGEVFSPVGIVGNMWWGEYDLAPPQEAARLLILHRDSNPMEFDYVKIRRRVEDALRKTSDQSILLEMARRLGVKVR